MQEKEEVSKFALPVDEEHKATELRLLSAAGPHMRAFHLAWLSLFTCYFSTFATPPLLPVLRRHLHLSPVDVAHAGVASVSGIIVARLAMGPACDLLGPRVASAALALLTAPAVYAASAVSSPTGFIVLRFVAGLSLANFVANQYWMSSMFAPGVVGRANGVSAGWANAGSGAAQFLMPLAYSFILRLSGSPSFSWRAAFLIPATLQVVGALAVLAFGQDLPDGNFVSFSRSQEKRSLRKPTSKEGFWVVIADGLGNYRGWILCLTYGYCYGVELAMENVVAEYFYGRFGLGVEAAGLVAACFGMANVVSRPAGGMISDAMGRRFGMRGRLWSLWVVQTVGGVLCVLLGRMSSLGASMAVMCCFAFFAQAASGLTYGVVPFVSKRSLGVISGLTGSGGALGGVVIQLLFFSGTKYSKETGISLMGVMVLVCTLPVSLIYFPQWGGMFCGSSTSEDDDPEEDYHLLK
ncbi:high affinity nitrate transporter 2.5-like [Musa acuminata AAA Group]|uniref:high affinity nitrate transporter 2.5-like n=1 Tax=Musa acuminata AAA Group TaxID=214697 RepID=UPI0031D2FF95